MTMPAFIKLIVSKLISLIQIIQTSPQPTPETEVPVV